MNPIGKLLLVGGGLALGLVAAGMAAVSDREGMRSKSRRKKGLDKPQVVTDLKKIWQSR